MTVVFAAIALGGACVATLVGELRRAVLALWVTGLAVGGIYLTLGAELLAVIQWLIATLVAISFTFFTVTFGEAKADRGPTLRRFARAAMALGLGGAFAAVAWLGAGTVSTESLAAPEVGNDLVAIGRAVTDEHLLALEVLALTLFFVLVGGGVVSRPEERGQAAVKRSELPTEPSEVVP
jgi:NADH-quinone oxidoreductase subunit J